MTGEGIFFAFLLLSLPSSHMVKKSQTVSVLFCKTSIGYLEGGSLAGSKRGVAYFSLSMSMYRGRCACCGAGKNSVKLKTCPRGFPIPPDFAGELTYRSEANDRICRDCQAKFYKSPVRARQLGPSGSPAVRIVTPRKRAVPAPQPIALDVALASRSLSVRSAAADALAKLPAMHKWQTSNVLAIMM